jgi:hypothetical protein
VKKLVAAVQAIADLSDVELNFPQHMLPHLPHRHGGLAIQQILMVKSVLRRGASTQTRRKHEQNIQYTWIKYTWILTSCCCQNVRACDKTPNGLRQAACRARQPCTNTNYGLMALLFERAMRISFSDLLVFDRSVD